MHNTHGLACHPPEPHRRTIIFRPTPRSSMEKPHGYLHDSLRTCDGHVTRQQRIQPSTCRHAAQRCEPFYLVLARVTVTVPVTAIVIQESKGEFLIHISPPSLSLPQTVCYIILPVLLSYSSTHHIIGEDQGRSWKDVQIACLQPCF